MNGTQKHRKEKMVDYSQFETSTKSGGRRYKRSNRPQSG